MSTFNTSLHFQVSKLSGALSNLGIGPGDRVLIYMPMFTEAVEAMLATVRLGAIHSVVFGGNFSPFVIFSTIGLILSLRFLNQRENV